MQRYLVEYAVYNEEKGIQTALERNDSKAIAVFNKFTFAKAPDEKTVMRAIKSSRERGDQLLRAWVIEWANYNAEWRIVYQMAGSFTPKEPGTLFLKQVRADSKRKRDYAGTKNLKRPLSSSLDTLLARGSRQTPPPVPEVKTEPATPAEPPPMAYSPYSLTREKE